MNKPTRIILMHSLSINSLLSVTNMLEDYSVDTLSSPPDNSLAHKELSTELIVPNAKRSQAQWKREQKVKVKGRKFK